MDAQKAPPIGVSRIIGNMKLLLAIVSLTGLLWAGQPVFEQSSFQPADRR